MICIKCFHGKTSVVNSRPHKKAPSIWRRRQCAHCHAVFTTIETPELNGGLTIDQRPLSMPRLTVTLAGYLTHHGEDAADDAAWLATTIVHTLWANRQTSTTRQEFTSTVHTVLERYDAAAGLRYATEHNLIKTTAAPRRGRPRITRL